MDLAREKDPIHGEEYIMQEASRLYGKHFRKILPFEAEKAYESVCKNDEKGMKDSGLTVLRQAIREEFFLTAREKQLDDIHDSIQDVKLSISDKINSIIQNLCDANKLYEDKRREWEDAIQSSEQDSIKKMQAIFDRTLQRIRRNATRYEDKIDSLEGENRTKFINDEVLEYDILARDLENFRAALEADISLLLRIYKDKMRFIEYENLFSLLQNQGDGYDNINIVTELGIDEDLFSTFGEKFFLSGVLGISAVVLLGPIGLAAAFLGPTSVGHTIIRWFQKVTGNGIVDKIVKSYQNKFNEEQVKLKESIHKNYQEACKRLMDLEDTTFAQVYVPISELSDLKIA